MKLSELKAISKERTKLLARQKEMVENQLIDNWVEQSNNGVALENMDEKTQNFGREWLQLLARLEEIDKIINMVESSIDRFTFYSFIKDVIATRENNDIKSKVNLSTQPNSKYSYCFIIRFEPYGDFVINVNDRVYVREFLFPDQPPKYNSDIEFQNFLWEVVTKAIKSSHESQITLIQELLERKQKDVKDAEDELATQKEEVAKIEKSLDDAKNSFIIED